MFVIESADECNNPLVTVVQGRVIHVHLAAASAADRVAADEPAPTSRTEPRSKKWPNCPNITICVIIIIIIIIIIMIIIIIIIIIITRTEVI